MLLFIIQFLHTLLILFEFLGPYVFNDNKILALLILLNILIVSGWYVFNKCILTDLESSLGATSLYSYKNGISKSFISHYLEQINGLDEDIVYYIFGSVPLINTGVCLYKILSNKNCF